jgi:methylated-DNA-protein-cysteine methyltransferase-like protein
MSGEPPGFFACVYALVRTIPRGRVASYGQVAALLGVDRGARAVGWALRALRGHAVRDVPWHRVLSSEGRISLPDAMGGAEQRRRLHAEGVRLTQGRVDLHRYGLSPAPPSPPRAGRAVRASRG